NVFFDLYDPIWGNSQWIPGFGILDTTNINGDTCDVYFNLFMDPLLTAPDNGDFSLITGSPCIDAGDPDFPFDPDSTIADIGALYFDQTGVFIQNRKTNKPDVKLYHYPNPANDFVSFVVESNEWYMLKNASIKIYSLSGIKIGEVPCPLINKGFGKKIYRYDLNNNIIKPGTYFYTFEANGKVLSSNKMIILR
ncbi:MAG: T9SS type A sorting domain-containing protein, partial [Chlorobi bacterium]|nr:T9SS type A sorting domain-containing protein [Chlorobiota bacterium]